MRQSSLREYEAYSLARYQYRPMPPCEFSVASVLVKLPGPAWDQPVVEPL